MIVRALCLVLLALPAHAEPLDDWLGALQPQHDQVLVVPELGRVVEPARDAWTRLTRHPAFGARADELKDAVTRLLVQYPPDVDLHARYGLDLSRPAFFAWGPGSRTDILPFPNREAAEGWLRHVLDAPLKPAKLLGREGWRAGDAVVLFADHFLYLGASVEAITPFVDAATARPAPLPMCPRQPGAADAFFLRRGRSDWPEALGRGCVTVRFEADRVRVDARVARGQREALAGWLRDASDLYPQLGDGTSTIVVGLGPKALARVRAAGASRAPTAGRALIDNFDGRIGFAAGPKLTDVVAVLGQRDDAKVLAATEKMSFPADVEVTREAPARWRIERPTPANWPRRVPRVETAWIESVPHGLRLRTRSPVTGDARQASGRARADLSVLQGAAIGLQAHFSGRPHDGEAYVDALSPVLHLLDVDAKDVREAFGALAFVGAHVAELVFSARVQGDALALSLEVLLL